MRRAVVKRYMMKTGSDRVRSFYSSIADSTIGKEMRHKKRSVLCFEVFW